MSCRDELKQQIAHLQAIGGCIEQLEIAEDIQQEIIGELVATLEDGDIPSGEVLNLTRNTLYGITLFEGYTVIWRPAGAGITIRYH
jgi:hypothetical protein